MDKQPVFKFHVISLGESTQKLGESTHYINRPFLQVDDLRKKWGDEYVVINSPLGEVGDKPRTYLGCIDLDKKHRKYLKLFKERLKGIEHGIDAWCAFTPLSPCDGKLCGRNHAGRIGRRQCGFHKFLWARVFDKWKLIPTING